MNAEHKCPHCGHWDEYLNYSVRTYGWGSGTINDDGEEEYDDSGTDSRDDWETTCRSCSRGVSHSRWAAGEYDGNEEEEDEKPATSTWSNLV